MRLKTLNWYFIIIILLLIVIDHGYKFIESENYIIEKVNINADNSLTRHLLEEVSDNLKGKNIWYINKNMIKNYLKKDVRIENIKIVKVLPNTIDIFIEEKSPVAYILYEKRIYGVNENGNIFAYRSEIQLKDKILLSVKNEIEINILLSILSKIDNHKFKNRISEIYIEEEDIILNLRDGVKIITNLEVEGEKYNAAYLLYQKILKENEKMNSIDLTVESDKFIVR
ncbi:MAG: FtsQ-type POTRA domain-containing protein [Fusobacteria bacterium]|nr:FtsQ-type POTRA domain-containing protein [Fusobacteriota bacterium]